MTGFAALPLRACRSFMRRVVGVPAALRRRGERRRLEELRRASSERLRALRNIHSGRRGWVIGNGPSLNEMDLSLLKGEITFACNAIFLLYDRTDWRPTYYTVEDPYVAEDRAAEINALHGPVKIFPDDLRHCLEADERTYCLHFVRAYEPFPQFSGDCSQRAYWGGTVSFLSLQLAHYLGCNPIYFIGMDMNYHVPDYMEGNEILSREADVNHFHPDYFGPGKRWHDPKVHRMIQSLQAGRDYLHPRGVMVYNATRGGKLEIFPRAGYEEVLASEQCGGAT